MRDGSTINDAFSHPSGVAKIDWLGTSCHRAVPSQKTGRPCRSTKYRPLSLTRTGAGGIHKHKLPSDLNHCNKGGSGKRQLAEGESGSSRRKVARARNKGHNSAMLEGERYTKRCRRWNWAGNAHELTCSCYRNRPFLSKERTCRYLIDAINASRVKHDFDLWAYVFMPDHVHLVIHPQR